jgi:hypothetical protein
MAQREQVFVGQPSIFGGGRLLPSPSQFFLTGEDKLRVVSANSLAGVSLKVQWRAATPAGDVVPSSQDHTPNSDRTVKRQDYELGSGSLLNVTVFASAGAPLSGQTFVIVQLVRGDGVAAIVLGTLLAGYVTAVQALGFPGSPITSSVAGEPYVRAIVGTTPALSVDSFETVPTGARWEPLQYTFTVTTAGVVATRYPFVSFIAAGNIIASMIAGATIAAGSTVTTTFAPNLPIVNAAAINFFQAAMTQRAILPAGSAIQAGAVNLQVGDQVSAPLYMVREWLEVS